MVAAMDENDMEVESSKRHSSSFVEDIYSSDREKCHQAVIKLKGLLIGSNRQKKTVVELGLVPRLINLLGDNASSAELKVNLLFALGSIGKGTDRHLKALIDSGITPALLNCLIDEDQRVVEACLTCLKTVFLHPDAPVDVLFANPRVISQLINLMPQSTANQISVATILTNACKNQSHQGILASHGVTDALKPLLQSPHSDVQLPALQCLSFLIIGNEQIAHNLSTENSEVPIIDLLVQLMDRDRRSEIQLAAARCITYLYRGGVLHDNDDIITYKALPCVVRMTKRSEIVKNRIMAAETLAYLIEASASLQRVAAISNHLIVNMSSYLTWHDAKNESNNNLNENDSPIDNNHESKRQMQKKEMQRAAFRVFASLGANDEDIRKKIIETNNLMPSIVSALDDPDLKLQMAAIGCLHSMSRSVQLLRTTFQDHPVWKPLMKLLTSPNSSDDLLIVASSTLCNLLLEFSPSKAGILESGAIDMLCHLTHKHEPSLRLNGVWGLMNMAFQAEQHIKVQILKTLGSDQVFRLLSDQDISVVMKTLGMLRNVLSHQLHIDHIMNSYGKQIMQAVVLILESDNDADVKEQALCILANIADGDSAKDFIMTNEDVLKKVTSYMMHNNTKLQIAAVFCVQNLARAVDEGSRERQAKLREIGVYRILQGLLSSTDTALFDKVKGALQEFSE